VVAEVAVKSATEDPRFVPMTQSELARATIEISILSPPRQVTDFAEIEVGRHGLIIELGRLRGLLLPQVATEYGWDRETFLDQTARKAGLPLKAWRDPAAKVYLFSAEIIEEHPE
jgi:AmmeMemoRadiSam system protein A